MKPTTALSDRALDALGSPIRRQIVQLLAQKEHTVGGLAKKLPVSRPAVSRHLRVLEGARLVSCEVRGQRSYCHLEPRGFHAVRVWMDAFWSDALSRFELVARNTAPRSKRG